MGLDLKHRIPINQKIEILEKTLRRLKNKSQGGLCTIIRLEFNKHYEKEILLHYSEVHLYFPELIKYKPQNRHTVLHWWPTNWYGRQIRKRVLRRIIKELKSQTSHKHQAVEIHHLEIALKWTAVFIALIALFWFSGYRN